MTWTPKHAIQTQTERNYELDFHFGRNALSSDGLYYIFGNRQPIAACRRSAPWVEGCADFLDRQHQRFRCCHYTDADAPRPAPEFDLCILPRWRFLHPAIDVADGVQNTADDLSVVWNKSDRDGHALSTDSIDAVNQPTRRWLAILIGCAMRRAETIKLRLVYLPVILPV